MTHYTVGIITPESCLADVDRFIDQQMEHFDDSRDVEPYVCYSPEQAEQDLQDRIALVTDVIERRDPACDLKACDEALAILLGQTSEQVYQDFISRHDVFSIRGEPMSTRNPHSKWNSFTLGGRWGGWFYDRSDAPDSLDDNLATVAHVINSRKFPFALITPDGTWHDCGPAKPLGIQLSSKPIAVWHDEVEAILRRHPDHFVILLDAHL